MNLYLDTEFNGHGGELISLAIVRTDKNDSWYGVWPEPKGGYVPWVSEHVVPNLGLFHPELLSAEQLRISLHAYLKFIDDGDMNFYADWPADFEHLLRCMVGPTYDAALYMPFKMHMIITPPGEPRPAVPHNAFSDAQALADWHTQPK